MEPAKMTELSSKTRIDDVFSQIRISQRFSLETINYIKRYIDKGGLISTYSTKEDIRKFWQQFYKAILKAKKAAHQSYSPMNIYFDELAEIAAWAGDMVKTSLKSPIGFKENLSTNEDKLAQKFHFFINGNVSYLNKLIKSGNLSKKFQERIFNAINNEFEDNLKIDDVLTKINKEYKIYETLVLKSNSFVIIRSSVYSNVDIHINNALQLLKSKNNEFNKKKDCTVMIGDIITSLENGTLEKLALKINGKKTQYPIIIHYYDEFGIKKTGELSNQKNDEIKENLNHSQSLRGERIRHLFNLIFLRDRTFFFTQNASGWVKQANSYDQKLKFWIGLEQRIRRGCTLSKIRNYLSFTFLKWSTKKGSHSKKSTKIGGVEISEWVNCLTEITPDSLGFRITFNFRRIKPKFKNVQAFSHGRDVFFSRFDPKVSGSNSSVPDRWNGIIYDKFGKINGFKSNKFVFRVRRDISKYEGILHQRILARLEKIGKSNVFDLTKTLSNNPIIKSIWMEAGNKTPNDILKSLVNDDSNPLVQLKRIKIKFQLVNARKTLQSAYKQFIKSGEDNLESFLTYFTNKNLVDIAKRQDKIMIEVIPKGVAYHHLSMQTKNEIPIPRFSNSKGFVYPSIINESENSTAIRIFLDIITTSKQGRKILEKLGFMSEKKKGDCILIDWRTGTATSRLAGQATGLLDGIISIKRGREYINEFIVEMIGYYKGNETLSDLMEKGPFSSVLGDTLRIACYGAAGKPGMVAHASINKAGDLEYMLMIYDQVATNALRQHGAQLAIDINRKKVKGLLSEGKQTFIEQLKKIFKMTSNIDFGPDLHRYSVDSSDVMCIFAVFRELVEIILKKYKDKESNI